MVGGWGGGEGRGEERRRGVLERSPIHLHITIALDEKVEKVNPPEFPVS